MAAEKPGDASARVLGELLGLLAADALGPAPVLAHPVLEGQTGDVPEHVLDPVARLAGALEIGLRAYLERRLLSLWVVGACVSLGLLVGLGWGESWGEGFGGRVLCKGGRWRVLWGTWRVLGREWRVLRGHGRCYDEWNGRC